MPGFLRVPAPIYSPTRCVACHSNRCEQGFIDLLVRDAHAGYTEQGTPIQREGEAVKGHLYLCGACVGQAASVAGWLSPSHAADLSEALELAQGRVDKLAGELETERERPVNVMSVEEFLEVLEQRRGTPTEAA